VPTGLVTPERLGFPGEYPFTRGVQPTMYRGRFWTMRQYAGFASARESNQRYHALLKAGQTGLSVAFDLPTQMGFDADSPRARGEVGKVGVSICSVRDMATLLDGIPLGEVSTSMTINATAPILLMLYAAVGDRQGVPLSALSGTVQNDILKEYIARGTYIYPPGPSLRLITNLFAYCAKHVPKWNPISISGYHIREAGATAVQELAFTLADGIGYVELGLAAGLDVDTFAPRLSFFWDIHNDFFEEVAKLRAARRMWARLMRDRFGAKNPRSWLLRAHAQTAGVSLVAQQPLNNVVRTTLQALAAVLGGVQSLHTNSFDETYALPTEAAATLALRTQQVIAEESGIPAVVDPLGGSYYLETLTDEMEAAAQRYLDAIDAMGGITRAIEEGYPQREIANAAYQTQREIDEGRRAVVGVNRYVSAEAAEIPTLKIDPAVEADQIARVKAVRTRRSASAAQRGLDEVRRACESDANVMDAVLTAVKSDVTLGEICQVFRDVFGEHRDPAYV
jgi:methylmalonyl-CoA mutase N-terminal domain/subunit